MKYIVLAISFLTLISCSSDDDSQQDAVTETHECTGIWESDQTFQSRMQNRLNGTWVSGQCTLVFSGVRLTVTNPNGTYEFDKCSYSCSEVGAIKLLRGEQVGGNWIDIAGIDGEPVATFPSQSLSQFLSVGTVASEPFVKQ